MELSDFEDYIKVYPFNVLRYILEEFLNLKLMVKSTEDRRKRPVYEEVWDIKKTFSLGILIQTTRLGWVKIDTCTFKLEKI